MNQELPIKFGNKIRRARQEQNLSIAALSQQCGISKSMISQIERDIAMPSALILWKISKALGKSMTYFFNEDSVKEKIVVTRKGQFPKLHLEKVNDDVDYELLSPKDDRKVELLKITIKKRYEDAIFVTHEGEECGYVLQGRLMVRTNLNEYVLDEGDSIELDSTIPHCYINVGEGECISIWTQKPGSW